MRGRGTPVLSVLVYDLYLRKERKHPHPQKKNNNIMTHQQNKHFNSYKEGLECKHFALCLHFVCTINAKEMRT